jgi:L-alanine-DL-glutamate epimerase-like enolase superfamily enzyme
VDVIVDELATAAIGAEALMPQQAWARMQVADRQLGHAGIAAMAVSAIDVALWDLKARLLDVCLADALPRFHAAVPVYGSGGFTNLSLEHLRDQVRGSVDQGIPRVKIKIGRDPAADPRRVRAVREVVGDDVEVMVDANGAYRPKEALLWAERFAQDGVRWFEEPVTSQDHDGLAFVRAHGPAGMAIAAGEYAWGLPDAHALLAADAVDVLQADVSRCGGITNLLRIDGLCKARSRPFSIHCVPAISAHAGCAMETLIHAEYFFDHVRIEALLFDGTLDPAGGRLTPDRSRPGLGLELRRADAEQYEVHRKEIA